MITDRLFEMQDTGYRYFQRRLMPDIPKEKVIGVRTPALRKLAKELAGYTNQSKFAAVFKKQFGVSPLEYRRKSRLE